MIGVSLPFKWLIGESDILGDIDETLSTLKSHNVKSIEIRTIRAKHKASDALKAAELLWNHGFFITAHAYPTALETAIDEVFVPLKMILEGLRQESLTVTIHPINDDNVAMLNALADYRDAHGYPISFVLENNRLLPDKTEGDATALVLDAVKKADRANVGICFDMGHYLYYRKKNFPNTPFELPPKEFFTRVVHTHIHSAKELTTHFPIQAYPMPLDEMIYPLYPRFYGVYNLELDFPRIKDEFDPLTALVGSVKYLDKAMPIAARLFDEYRESFDSYFMSALKVYGESDGSHLGLIHSTSYLFNTNGYAWAMDVAFRHARALAKAPDKVAELFRNVKLMVFTHGHADHFEESTIRKLSGNDMKWLVPDFLADDIKEFGISEEKIIVAHADKEVTIGPLTFLPFKSLHFRPDTGKGLDEYGYIVTSDGAPSMSFPGDIRDFSIEKLPSLPKTDYCFAHVWLGDNNSFAKNYGNRPEEFSKFMLHFSEKNIILAHLYECGRRDSYMWRHEHAEIIKNSIQGLSKKTNVLIPSPGEMISFK